MRLLYTFFTHIAWLILQGIALFNSKIKLFVMGRKNTFLTLKQAVKKGDQNIWFHCASLGEFEQGLPIIKAVKKHFPKAKIIVTFFSPSGYENKKNTPVADAVCYLPMDTMSNAKQFIALVQPSLALFVKYEVWPNYLQQLHKSKTPTLLISGLFRKNQIYFKPYGNFMRKALKSFDHYFVQDENSKSLLESINISAVTVSGDTRFDRVSQQIETNNDLDYMDTYMANPDDVCIVLGSTWPEDEAVLLNYINKAPLNVKFVIAPHKIDPQKIKSLTQRIEKTCVTYSQITAHTINDNLNSFTVLIVDTIGHLTKIYSYADIAYVGGAMGETGLHNILEPATFNVPIVIGKNYDKFPEAHRLRSLGGLFSVSNTTECSDILEKLVTNQSFRQKTGMICGHFINSNTGATHIITNYLKNILKL